MRFQKILRIFRRSSCLALYLMLAGYSLPAFAEVENIDCLLQTKGKVVRWDKDWQSDAQDQDVLYSIEQLEVQTPRNSPRQIVLTLQANSPAQKTQRTATIVKELAARLFCERIEGGLADKSKGVLMALGGRDAARTKTYEIDNIFPTEAVSPEELPFRAYHLGTWLPARPKLGEKRYLCRIAAAAFSCGENDFRMVEEANKREGRSYQPLMKFALPGPFLRFTDAGWIRAEPIGLDPKDTLGECPLLGRKFYCLTAEKDHHRDELKELEAQLKLFEALNSDANASKEPKKGKRRENS